MWGGRWSDLEEWVIITDHLHPLGVVRDSLTWVFAALLSHVPFKRCNARTAPLRMRDFTGTRCLHLKENTRALTCVIDTKENPTQPWSTWEDTRHSRDPAPVRRMSGADGAVNKVKVKRQIRTIVKDLENILGDLKDVAKELKEVCVCVCLSQYVCVCLWMTYADAGADADDDDDVCVCLCIKRSCDIHVHRGLHVNVSWTHVLSSVFRVFYIIASLHSYPLYAVDSDRELNYSEIRHSHTFRLDNNHHIHMISWHHCLPLQINIEVLAACEHHRCFYLNKSFRWRRLSLIIIIT